MEQDLNEMLFNGLNEQGFILQEKCSEVIDEQSSVTHWRVHTTEHPVSLKGQDTRIDIIIREDYPEYATHPSKFGVIECKKVNPFYNCWLFGNPLYDKPIHARAQIVKLSVGNSNNLNVVPIRHDFDVNTYIITNWWMQVNINPRNERNRKYSDTQPLENAFIQACLGVGGLLAERIRQISKTIKDGAKEFYDISDTYFIPIIVTTCPLYVTKYDLSDVDISNGRIEKDRLSFVGLINSPESVNWVLVDYGAPTKTIPDAIFENFHGVDPVELEPYNRRSIFVVNSSHLTDFLADLHTF